MVASCLWCLSDKQFFLCEPCFRKTMKLSAMAFPCYFKGFAQCCIKIPYTSGESHCINDQAYFCLERGMVHTKNGLVQLSLQYILWMGDCRVLHHSSIR